MKRVQLFLNIIAVFVDYAMIILAGLAAYTVRYTSFVQDFRPVIFDLERGQYINLLFIFALAWLVVFAFIGLYTTTYSQRITQELKQVFVGCSLGFMTVVTFMFGSRELFSSRFIILAAVIFSIIFVSIGRMLLRALRRFLLKHNKGITTVILIGDDSATKTIASIFFKQPVWGFRIAARLSEFDAAKIDELRSQQRIDEVFMTDSSINRAIRVDAYDYCIQHHLGFRYSADMFDAQSHNVVIQTFGGVPIIEIKKTRLDGWGRVIKRLFDFFVGLLALIILSPVLLIIAVAIKIDSSGPVIYKNIRVGKDGKEFTMYKFRRMLQEYCTGTGNGKKAEEFEKQLIQKSNQREGGLYKIINDPRSTRVGRFIERFSLDELPQLFNVIIGNMSLVGPRPHQMREVEKFPKNHERVMALKPGITGLAQISGRSDLDTSEELRLDVYYIENWSLQLDINILFKTPFALLKRHKS